MNNKIIWFRVRNILIFGLLMNIVLIISKFIGSSGYSIFSVVILLLLFVFINIVPVKGDKLSLRLNIMISGYELIIDTALLSVLEIFLYVYLLIFKYAEIGKEALLMNLIISLLILLISLTNGILRIMFTSRDLGIISRLLIIFLWWVPGLNMFLIYGWCKKARYEYFLEESKQLRNESRKENEICKTKYPVVMVHGIFFRDWMFLNYWGRIPKELIRNGVQIFYGQQQSSNSICKSAEELKDNIIKIVKETGCEKVNIIAHSKGGLDSRYAISCLGLSKYVASLTTINTPHRGCKYVDYLLEKIPNGFKNYIAKKYNNTFIKLGDKNPDFLAGVNDLTHRRCEEFNKNVPDCEGILYQSITSKMKNVFAAPFPLNLGYIITRIFDGKENDGLVEVSSAKWGNFLGILNGDKKGISHGDVIDLLRQDIKGYDVCEFYVNLVKNLKDKGL